MGLIIFLNICLMMAEANHFATCYPDMCYDPVMTWLNRTFLVIYTIEAILRGFAERRKYCYDMWNIFDASMVVFGWADGLLVEMISGQGSVGMRMLPILRILRVARLFRAVRLLRLFPDLFVMIKGFIGAMRAMMWGFLLIVILLAVWSLVLLELVQPASKDATAAQLQSNPDAEVSQYCEDAFSGIFPMSILLFQTLVAGDSWGQCVLPIIQHAPLTFIPFAIALVSVTLGIMNLVLAAIVDHAVAARDVEREEKAKQKQRELLSAIKQLLQTARRLDKDGNGRLTYDEMMSAFDDAAIKDMFEALGITKEDLSHMYSLMDCDGSGDLDYDEFVAAFLTARLMDEKIYMMMIKLQTDSIARTVSQVMDDLKEQGTVDHVSTSVAAVSFDATSASLDVDLQRMDECIQEQFNALADMFKAAVQVTRPPLRSAAVSLDRESVQLRTELQCSDQRIQEQFSALGRCFETNALALTRNTDMLKALVRAPEQVSAESAVQPAAHPDRCGAPIPNAEGATQSLLQTSLSSGRFTAML